ncbi:hypothetical protein NQ318_016858, partial [Aromia moschata]
MNSADFLLTNKNITYEIRTEIKRLGRPIPDLIISKTDLGKSRNYSRNFNSSVYDRFKWLCGSPKRNKLFCFICLLMGGNQSAWTQEGGSNELVGKCSIRPEVKFTGGSHASPPSQPLLKWYKFYQNEDSLGEVLAAFELSEVSDKAEKQVELGEDGKKVAEDDKKGVEVVKIPQDLKPKLVSYRIEVLFWGMRDLRKEIALQKEFVPPLCIQLHDSRRFGVYTYAGVHVAGIAQFLYHPITSEERMNYLSGGGYASYESLRSGD